MIFDRFRKMDNSVKKSRESFFGRLAGVFQRREIDEELWEELEELLIQADVGVETADSLIETLRLRAKTERIGESEELFAALKEELKAMLERGGERDLLPSREMCVVMVVTGVGCWWRTRRLPN